MLAFEMAPLAWAPKTTVYTYGCPRGRPPPPYLSFLFIFFALVLSFCNAFLLCIDVHFGFFLVGNKAFALECNVRVPNSFRLINDGDLISGLPAFTWAGVLLSRYRYKVGWIIQPHFSLNNTRVVNVLVSRVFYKH